MIGFNAPIKMVEALDEISIKRWGKVDRSNLLHEAVSDFIERETNPLSDEDRMAKILRERPQIVAEAIRIFHETEGGRK